MGKRCSLCGGKLVDNVCVECGLDNSKSDDSYTWGKSTCETKPMTHVHDEKEDPLAEKTMTEDARRAAETKKKQRAGYDNKSKKNTPAQILTVLVFIVTIGGAVIPWIGEKITQFQEPEQEVWSSEPVMQQDPYFGITREIPETGEPYSVTLGAGLYKCGVHIPEGVYRVVLESGSGSLNVEDEVNYISLFYSFGNDSEIEEIREVDDVRIYKGALVTILDNVTLRFETENAQMELGGIANPNTESRTLEEQFVVGKDIPAGVYDVYCEEGSGIFEYYIPMDGYDSYEGKLIGDSQSTLPRTFKNVVLPDGVEVTITGMKVTLTPSEIIESVDYDKFYSDM